MCIFLCIAPIFQKLPNSFGMNGGDDGTRTRGLCRDSVAWIGFTTTYKNAGTAKRRASHTRPHELWVGLWVGIFRSEAPAPQQQPSGFEVFRLRIPPLDDAGVLSDEDLFYLHHIRACSNSLIKGKVLVDSD